MKITLYEKCDLTSEYKDTFRNIELLNQYLNTLPNSEIDLPTNYWNLNGSIILDYDASKGITNGRVWNYIKIVDTTSNNFIYAFIDNFELFNDAMRISYSCDYWHTFLPKFSIRESFILNSRYIPYENLTDKVTYDYPLDFISNNGVKINKVETNIKLSIVAEIQLYKLSTAGVKNRMRNITRVVSKKVGENELKYEFDFNEVNRYIDDLAYYQSGRVVLSQGVQSLQEAFIEGGTQTPNGYFYKISNLYVIPSIFLTDKEGNLLIDNVLHGYTDYIDNPGGEIYMTTKINSELINIEIKKYTIPSNKLIRSYGFYTKQKPYYYNGRDKVVDIKLCFDDYDFKLYMYDEMGVEDITKYFTTNINFDYLDAQALMQQRIDKALRLQVLENSKMSTGVQMATGAVTSLVGVGETVFGGMSGNAGLVVSGISTTVAGGGVVVNGFIQLDTINAKIEAENKQRFQNVFNVSNEDFARINAYIGFCYNTIDEQSILNQNEVENSIKNVGFRIGFYSNSLDLDATNYEVFEGYNPIKFGYVKISGLPSTISFIIERILLNGTKIWYKGDLS